MARCRLLLESRSGRHCRPRTDSFSKDRDVFYDGHGPQREYTVTTTGGSGYQTAAHRNAERVVNITWGADVPPPINGRNYVVNRNSSKVMEVASASTASGANIQQNAYSGGTHQQWDVTPLASSIGRRLQLSLSYRGPQRQGGRREQFFPRQWRQRAAMG